MTASGAYSSAMPSASRSLSRCTNRSVISSGVWAFWRRDVVIADFLSFCSQPSPAWRHKSSEVQEILMPLLIIIDYGTAPALLLHRGGGRRQLHQGRREASGQSAGRQRPGPAA